MNNDILQQVLIGVAASLLTVLLLAVGKRGVHISTEARNKARAKKIEEESQWKSMDVGARQGITNKYLFDTIRCMLLAMVFGTAPNITILLDMTGQFGFMLYRSLIAAFNVVALAAMLLGLGKVGRYLYLRSLDND